MRNNQLPPNDHDGNGRPPSFYHGSFNIRNTSESQRQLPSFQHILQDTQANRTSDQASDWDERRTEYAPNYGHLVNSAGSATYPSRGHPVTATSRPGNPYPQLPNAHYSHPPPISGYDNPPTLHIPPPVNPADIPLPDDNDDDFPPPSELLARYARPASKIAGSRRSNPDAKGKGKQQVDENVATSSQQDNASASSKKRKRGAAENDTQTAKKQKGRAPGAGNYLEEDIDALLDLLEEHLPLGGKGWNTVSDLFNKWARSNERPRRTAKSLENKFKQLSKATKPTGDAYCPPYIDRAVEIDELMAEKAGTRDLDDEDIVDAISINDSDEDEPSRAKKTIKKEPSDKTFVARRPVDDRLPSSAPRSRRNVGQDLLNTLSSTLSPAAQLARSEEHSARALQATQVLALNNRIRDLERSNENLRRDLSAAERRADRAELKLEFAQPHRYPDRNVPSRTPSRPPQVKQEHAGDDDVHVQEIIYPDGKARMVYRAGSTDPLEMQGFYDPPGTIRRDIPDHPDSLPPSPAPAFTSAASGLNNMLPDPPAFVEGSSRDGAYLEDLEESNNVQGRTQAKAKKRHSRRPSEESQDC